VDQHVAKWFEQRAQFKIASPTQCRRSAAASTLLHRASIFSIGPVVQTHLEK
jgi:hypothetical protein